jgi:hypothetical protein
MKWFLIVALGVCGCADNAPPPPPGGAGPIVPPGGFAGSGGSGGVGGNGGAGGAGGLPRGDCDNASDFSAIEGAAQNLRTISANCGASVECAANIGNSAQYGLCVTGCVEEGVNGLSIECAACYGDLERCTLDAFCRDSCQLNPCGLLCANCLENAGCITEYEQCRGVSRDGCPG